MKKMKKCSKGFTLTELAVVIAVIAILIAVLVPTFISIIESANKTSDNLLVTNVNEVLSVDEAINGKPSNIDEALEIAEDGGFKVENLTTASEGTLIVWNETENEFIYVNSELDDNDNFVEVDGEAITSVASYNLWVITESYNSTYAAYSQYISGTITSLGVDTVSAGISVGDNADIDINYENSDGVTKSVTFVTKGGTLTVNDASATVYHYGTADEVVVTAVDSNSYHLHGEVAGNIELKKGHLVLESKATAAAVLVTAEKSSDISIENNSSNSASIPIAATDPDVASQLDTIVKGTGKSEVKTEATNEIALLYFESGLGTEEKPYMISTAQQFANISKVSVNSSSLGYSLSNQVHYKLANNIALTTGYIFSATYDDGSVDYYPTFGGYLYNAVLDGAEYTVSATGYFPSVSNYSHSIFYQVYNSEIKNLTVNMGGKTTSIAYWLFGTSKFTNVDTTGTVTFPSRNLGVYSVYTYDNITFDTCTNYATITGIGGDTSYCAVFVGYSHTSWTLDLTFNNCENAGSLTAGKAAMFIGNLCGTNENINLSISNCKNTGSIRSTYTEYTPDYYIASGSVASSNNFVVDGVNYDSGKAPALSNVNQGPNDTVSLTTNEDGYFVIGASSIEGAAYYVVSIGLYTKVDEDHGGGTDIWYVRILVTASQFTDSSYLTSLNDLKFMDISTYISKSGDTELSYVNESTQNTAYGSYTYYTVTVDNVTYYLINDASESLSSGIGSATTFTVSVYDENGTLLSSASK